MQLLTSRTSLRCLHFLLSSSLSPLLHFSWSSVLIVFSFPPPKIFTNALLHPHDITALIRDTEAHERALFRVAPPEPGSYEPIPHTRKSMFPAGDNLKGGYAGIKPNTAVGRILGGEFMEKVRKGDRASEGKEKADVDVEMLLDGAEKLHSV